MELDKIDQEAQEGLLRNTATKILDNLGCLRMSSNKNNARRWVWELMQNAKDARGDSVEVLIDYNQNDNLLHFSHTGLPFTTKNITSLIHQVSSKPRGVGLKKTTGKFGTGFLTTHLLSEIVNVKGYLEEDDGYKEFDVSIDRSGRTPEEILQAIEKAIDNLKVAVGKSPVKVVKNRFGTVFSYKLNDKGNNVAAEGLSDLEILLCPLQCSENIAVYV